MKLRSVAVAAGLVAMAAAFAGCEWSGGGDNGFNTSQGAIDVNISGVYAGTLPGGKVVSQTSGATISRLTINQVGNSLEVIDSNGQRYRGTTGSPGAVLDLNAVALQGVIPNGAGIASYQVFFSGTDGVAAREIEFTGIIDVVTVTDVEGDSTTQNFTSNSATENSTERTSDSTSSSGGATDTTRENSTSFEVTTEGSSSSNGGENTSPGGGGDVPNTGDALDTTTSGSQSSSSSTSSSTTGNSENSRESGTSSSSTATSGTSQDTTRTITTTFELSEANSQFRLRGTWIESGGFVSQVEARSAGAGLLSATVLPGDSNQNASNNAGGGNTGGGGTSSSRGSSSSSSSGSNSSSSR